MEIKNNTVVITGGAQGLGFAMAQKFAAMGANIALIDMAQDLLNNACEQLNQLEGVKGIIKGYAANVTVESEVENVFSTINNDFGHIGVLITPGAIAPTRIPKRPSSLAHVVVNATTPAFEAA